MNGWHGGNKRENAVDWEGCTEGTKVGKLQKSMNDGIKKKNPGGETERIKRERGGNG